jgi:hypothetical protein
MNTVAKLAELARGESMSKQRAIPHDFEGEISRACSSGARRPGAAEL